MLVDTRLPSLDGLRGVAALLVLLGHASNRGLHLVPGLDLSHAGKTGVYLFFVLSAFLLTSQMLAWERSRFFGWRSWAGYWLGRVFRIWPLYLLVLACCLVTTALAAPDPGVPVTLRGAALLDTFLLQRGDGILWTIPVEFKFYFLLPVIGLALSRLDRRRGWQAAAALTATAAAWLWIEPARRSVHVAPFLGLFLSGVSVAVLHAMLSRQPLGARARTAAEAAGFAMLVLAVALLPTLNQALFAGRWTARQIHTAHPLHALAWGGLILAMLHGRGILRGALESRTLRAVGTISFSLYLWHVVPTALLRGLSLAGPTLTAWIVVVSALALATLSYLAIERPALRLGRGLRIRLARTSPPLEVSRAA